MGVAVLDGSGRTGGKVTTEKYGQLLRLSNREAASLHVRDGSQIGWGKFSIEAFDEEEQKIVVTVGCRLPHAIRATTFECAPDLKRLFVVKI